LPEKVGSACFYFRFFEKFLIFLPVFCEKSRRTPVFYLFFKIAETRMNTGFAGISACFPVFFL
jgi:hypothetical protein